MINQENKFVEDVMETDNYCLIDGMETVAKAIKIAKKNLDIDLFIVNKKDDNDELGLVLMSDIAKKVLAANLSAERTNIYEIMSKPAISVAHNMQVKYCARLFERFGISVAPVVKNEQIVGVVSYTNMVLKGMVEDESETESESESETESEPS